jgi:hypothetical protein
LVDSHGWHIQIEREGLQNVEKTGIQWGNMSIYRLRHPAEHCLWTFDNSILVDDKPRVAFEGFGEMRAHITAHLWKVLGLREEYPKGWFMNEGLPQQSWLPQCISTRDMLGKCIQARAIGPHILQCTVDESFKCTKQFAFSLGNLGVSPEDSSIFFSEDCARQAMLQSEVIAKRIHELCVRTGIVATTGSRISWGITTEGILTPVGGIGLQDHNRYHLEASGVNYFMDRREFKRIFSPSNHQMEKQLQRAKIIRARSSYEAASTALTAAK